MTRDRLPNRRGAETFEVLHTNPDGRGSLYTVTVGFQPDGRVAEIFVSARKPSTDADISCRDAAILMSFALQHGATLESLSAAMCRGEKGEAHGVMGAAIDEILRLHPGGVYAPEVA